MRKQLINWLPFALIVVLVLLAALPILTYPMGRDQGMYANIGRMILNGGTPFVDMWDIKPPPIYYIYAAGIALFGATTAGVHAINFVLIPVGMLGLYLFGLQLRSQRLGLFAALLYGVFYFNDGFQNISQSDSLATVLLVWAAYAAFKAMNSDKLRWVVITGALCGLILWFKQYYLLFVLALVINQVWQRRRIVWREVLAFSIGGLLTGGTLLLYFWSIGIIGEMLIVAQSTASYNAQGYDLTVFITEMSKGLGFRWAVWHLLFILTLLWLPLRFMGQREQGWRLILLWLLSGFAFALIQAKGFDTHWMPMLPALALLGAGSIDSLLAWILQQVSHPESPTREGRTANAVQWLVVIVLHGAIVLGLLFIPVRTTYGRAWPYLIGIQSHAAYYDRFQANDFKPEQSLLVANYLRERVAVGDTLFIWGFRPEVYFMAELRPATRYQAHFPLVAEWYPQEWQQENVDILWAAMPPYVLILEDDYMEWVTNRPQQDSHQILQAYTELNNWLIANYDRVHEIGDFLIWQRRNS